MQTILHLSDLHFSRHNAEQSNYIRDALISDIKSTFLKTGRPDIVVFSGDLVNNPDEKDVYENLIDKFIFPLEQATGISSRKMIFCPGNHDISFSKIKDNSIEHDGLMVASQSTQLLNAAYSQKKIHSYAFSISEKFFDFCKYLDNPWENPFFHLYDFGGEPALSMNFAFGGTLSGSASDRGRLFFPAAAWEDAVSLAGKNAFGASIAHFPLDEMSEETARGLKAKIASSSGFYFFGHVHDPVPRFVTAPVGKLIELQSGALFQKDDRFKGYAVVQKDGEVAQAWYRTYFDGRRSFDEATNVATRGRVFLPETSEQFWKGQAPSYSSEQIVSHLSLVVLPEVQAEIAVTLSGDKLADIFVPPHFGEAEDGKFDDNGEAIERQRTIADIRTGDGHICFVFPEETGATSFLSYLALQFSGDGANFLKPRIPLTVDLRATAATYPAAVEKQLKASFPAIDHVVFGWRARASDQPLVILVDNYDGARPDHVEWIAEAFRQMPQARFLICARSPLAGLEAKAASATALRLPFGHAKWALYPLSRRQVRMLVNNFSLPENINRNVVVEEVFSKFRSVGMPLCGPLVTMYLTVIKDQKKYSPVNTSAVMENFLEISLDKRKSLVVFQDDFDYREQLNLLSVLAKHYVIKDVESVVNEDCYEIISDHYKSTGVSRDVSKIIRYFCDKGILENNANTIYFKYSVIFSFLIAHRMTIDPGFRDLIFHPKRMNRFITELDIYFGMNRADLAGIEAIASRYAELLKEIETSFAPILDAKRASQIQLPRADNLETFVDKVTERVAGQVTDEDTERDARLEDHGQTTGQFIQKFRRPEAQDSLIEWGRVLACYSVAIKNADEISKDAKERHLKIIFEGWEKVVGMALITVALLMSDGSVSIGKQELRFRARSITDPEIVRSIVASVPRYVSHFCGLYLGTGKLEALLKGMKFDGFADFLKVSILVDLRTDAFMHEINRFRREAEATPTVIEAMLWKLRDSFLRFGLLSGYVQSFQQIIVEMHADILGLKGENRTRKISDMLRRLTERRLLKRRND